MQVPKELLLERLGLFKEAIKLSAIYTILKFKSADDFNEAYTFFKKNFDPRCFNNGNGILPQLVLNRRGVEELAELWDLEVKDAETKTSEITIPSWIEACITYILN
tara:strand:- start:33 stop:350 length:318 start_codon:yes stop_codon:yes gene_type:complete